MSTSYAPIVRILTVVVCSLSWTRPGWGQEDTAAKREAALQRFSQDQAALTQQREAEARQLADEIGRGELRKVYVPDFDGPTGERDPIGCWLAADFSKLLRDNAKDFEVLSRADGHIYLAKRGWSDSDLHQANILGDFVSAFRPDVILWGRVSLHDDTYTLNFSLRDRSGKELSAAKYEEQASSSLAGYLPPTTDPSGLRFYFAGLDGITSPTCSHCPFPKYPDFKQKKTQGAVVLSILVTKEGKPDEIRIVKGLDPDLDRRSLEAVKSWRFRPAKDNNGTHVPVRVPIQVSFILY